MRGFQATLLVFFAAVLSTQAVRHVHLYLIGYEEPLASTVGGLHEVKEEIRLQESTDELLKEYEELQRQIVKLRQDNPETQPFTLQQENPDLYARHGAIGSELNERQRINTEIRDLWIFSVAGLILIGIGAWLFGRGNEWPGLSLIVPGMLELMWWSSPSFTLGGAVRELDVLLINKIVLTAIAIALLFLLWSAAQRRRDAARQ